MVANIVVSTLLEQVAARPDQEALVFEDHRFTFAELGAAVDRAAQALRHMDVGAGDRVAFLSANNHAYVITMIAAAKIGAISVPLNMRWAAEEVAYAIDHARPKVLMFDSLFAGLANDAAARAGHAVQLCPLIDGDETTPSFLSLMAAQSDEPVATVEVDDSTVHRILFTSGTTSRPKGALHTHRGSNANHAAMARDVDVRAGDRGLVMYPLFHVSGLECPGVFSTLAAGATCVLANIGTAEQVLELLQRERITSAVILPPLYDEVVARAHAAGAALPELRWLLTGAVTPAVVRDFMARMPGKRLIEVYAMTETTGAVTALDEANMERKAGLTGRPITGVEVRVVGEGGEPLPANSVGVIHVRGEKVSPGYWGDEATPRGPADWFDTGDLGELDEDGYLAYRGRAKEMIKTGGENVALAEIERVLSQHPAVKALCVVRIPDARWGEAPKAFVLLHDGAAASADDLESFCRESLAGYKVPRVWEFVTELPFNHSGKVLRRVLQEAEDRRHAEAAG